MEPFLLQAWGNLKCSRFYFRGGGVLRVGDFLRMWGHALEDYLICHFVVYLEA